MGAEPAWLYKTIRVTWSDDPRVLWHLRRQAWRIRRNPVLKAVDAALERRMLYGPLDEGPGAATLPRRRDRTD